ncbi:RNA polymerase sigma factor [Reichenbachiella ulvae]|uniref:Sigma-70 family RNA polymerase sigma factor n=1 Tax=Reichenbachiella ulvae TaxID=2980104 RepID=A0ABT3CYB6_9BACT|nr:sigma-70 family RNA polymerase sigma factor [Reichenbachiella ulvae]MCV9388198.1 sigma-70 family RNA polymerase sigma factor [Reichenbachiella ulvae]
MTVNKPNTDKEIIQAYKRSGDMELLGELYEQYMHLVLGVCLKYLKSKAEAQDAVIEIFEELVVKLQNHEVDHFKSWLYVLTRNHCLMKLRKQKSRGHEEEIGEAFMESEPFQHHEDETRLEDNLEKLKSCIAKLKEEQKRCVDLFFLQEKCYQEIADSTNFDLKKVKSYIQNGKRNLKICMEQSE